MAVHCSFRKLSSISGAVIRAIKQHTMMTTEHMTPEIKLHLITPLCELWTARAEDVPFKDPFWAFYWPGGQALARFLLDNSDLVKKRHVLDVGSGSGACAIAAALSGARSVTANDIDPVAAVAIAMNCALNGVDVTICNRDLVGQSCDDWDCILLGDMFYDLDFAQKLCTWLEDLSSKGKLVLIGDPGRHGFKLIKERALIKVATYNMPEYLCKQNNGLTDMSVWKFR